MRTGVSDHLVSAADEFLRKEARARQAGVIAMKVLCYGEVQRRDLAIRYSLGLPGVHVAVIGLDDEQQSDEVVVP